MPGRQKKATFFRLLVDFAYTQVGIKNMEGAMTGLFLLAALAIWWVIVKFLVKKITAQFPEKWWRTPVRICLFSALMVLPVADEIIGGIQFRALCEQSRQVNINKDKAMGRTITMRDAKSGYVMSNDRRIPGVALPITESKFIWRDIETNEPILSYKSLNIRGGWFIRLLGISEGDVPLLIENTSCMPDISTIFSEFELKQAK